MTWKFFKGHLVWPPVFTDVETENQINYDWLNGKMIEVVNDRSGTENHSPWHSVWYSFNTLCSFPEMTVPWKN